MFISLVYYLPQLTSYYHTCSLESDNLVYSYPEVIIYYTLYQTSLGHKSIIRCILNVRLLIYK